MAYVNVLEWKAEQVADWLRGLDDVVYPYAHFFLNNDVTGQRLLNMTVDDLYKLHVEKLGHQEIILESLELLRNFHYNLDQENLQYISLRLSCKARSLYNEMSLNFPKAGEKQVVTAPVMSSVADVLDSVRLLLSWLGRKPFDLSHTYHALRTSLIGLSLELATNAQRDTFAEQPMDVIRSCCDKLAGLADKVIQDFTDPFILQPASLGMADVKKKPEEELGIVLETAGVHGIHLVTETRMLNPSARVEPGDEIVQVNYQTVVGWQTKKVIQLMNQIEPAPAHLTAVILTLKKRPRHLISTSIYMKKFKIPNRKKNDLYFNNLPSPRTELLVVPDVSLPITKRRTPSESSSDVSGVSETETDSEDDEAFLPVAASEVAGQIQRNSVAVSPTASVRSVLSRPRSAPQRRATISGVSASHIRPYINVSEIWPGLRDTSSDFPSSTLSSKDSGVSTLSNKKSKNSFLENNSDLGPELRERPSGEVKAPRPITIAAPSNVTSAPNLLGIKGSKVTGKPRMPEPEETEELHVNRIHVSSPGVTNSVYMNVPKHPEYVNYAADSKQQYVNVPETSQPSTPKQPLPKPRLAAAPSPGPVTPGEDRDLKRGKRPVPLPRRLSSISVTSSTSSHLAAPITPSPSPVSSGSSSQSSSPSHFFAKSRESSSTSKKPVPVSSSTPGRRKGSSSDVPTPTANFKSYRRAPPSGENRRQKQPAPPAPVSTKLKSVTRLSFEAPTPGPHQGELEGGRHRSQGPQHRRADSGLGHSDSGRMSSVSSVESSENRFPTSGHVESAHAPGLASPVRILVKQDPARSRRPSSQYYEP